MLQDLLAQLGVGLRNLADEEHHVEGGGSVGVSHEVHEHVDDAPGHVWELDGALVDGLDQQLPVLAQLVARVGILSLDDLLLQDHDDLQKRDGYEGDGNRKHRQGGEGGERLPERERERETDRDRDR